MKPQSIFLVMALLTACALSYGQTVTPGGAQDYEAMAKAMERAQAEANQPGDQRLTCDQLQAQLIGIAQDPAFQAQMQVPKSGITAKSAATLIASTVPGAAMSQMMVFMPKLMRGQRLIEPATVRKCEWATGLGVPSIPNE